MYNDKTPPFSSGLWLKTAVLGPQTAVFPESLEKRYLTRISCVFVVLGCPHEGAVGMQEGELGWPSADRKGECAQREGGKVGLALS